nr:DUF2163 domain-containing protein [uncultured Rhodopila sp.]
MKSPIWESSPGALMALLFPSTPAPTARCFCYFDLYTITTVQGPVLRYTTCDRDVGYGGTVWSASTVRIEPASARNALFHAKTGLDVDSWQAMFYPRPADDLTGAPYPDMIGSVPWLAAAAAGALSGATVTVDRAYTQTATSAQTPEVDLTDGYGAPVLDGYGSPIVLTPAWPSLTLKPVGVLRVFAGRVAEVDLGRSGACITINSHLELLNVQIPRNLFQAGCSHRLFDAGCTLAAASYAYNSACSAGSTRYVLVSGLGAPGGSETFTLGRVVFLTGLNTGFSRSVRSWDGANFTLVSPLPFIVATGDVFTAYPGCDKQMSTCSAFGNLANFKGCPFIPAPEAAS